MLPDPDNVCAEGLRELICLVLELGRIVEEDEIELREWRGDLLVLDAPIYDGCKTLVQRGGKCNLSLRHLRCDRIRAENEYHRIRASNQRLDAYPPVFKGINFGTVDERLEATRLERRLKTVRKAISLRE